MSPPARTPPQLLAHMPQIPAPCLNRCSINNACLNATHLPGAQSGKRREDEGDAMKWMSLLGRGARGTKNGRGPRSLSDYWEMDWPHQKMLKDQWTWGWSVLLVPSAPNSGSEKTFLCYLDLREICWKTDKRGSRWVGRGRGRGYIQHACVSVWSTLRGIM